MLRWVCGHTRRDRIKNNKIQDKVRKLQRVCLRNPVKIEAASKYSIVGTLKQQYRFLPAKYKDCYLIYILTEMSSSTSMVFTRTYDATHLLALMLRNLGLRAIPISGQMTQGRNYPSILEEEEVLLLLDHVTEAKRISLMAAWNVVRGDMYADLLHEIL
ncbi:hypothetical protein CQW23_10219 [Capsicum baccatum]|uniref:Uncharacterized protein n=1 Tax=Capsicum baccatum TaxID=33114 RepID=A0A2G2WZ15_CAPBA|nr:hypothetical protein CQW23_10219 [Capsicum baccatum]